MMELYKIYVVKEDGKRYVDLYLCWYFKKVRYERVIPVFKGFNSKCVLSRAVTAKNVQEMKATFTKKLETLGKV